MPNLEQKAVSRRGFICGFSVVGAAALLSACGAPQAASPTAKPAAAPPTAPPAAPPTTAPAAKAAEPKAAEAKPTDASQAGADWDRTGRRGQEGRHTGGRNGGRLGLSPRPGSLPGSLSRGDRRAHGASRQRLRRPRSPGAAGKYLQLRHCAGSYHNGAHCFAASRSLGAVRPVITRPDVLDDKVWDGGFDGGWPDIDKKWAYAFCNDKARSLWVHTGQIAQGEIRSFKDLTDSKYKGKIMIADPRTEGRGYWPMTTLRANLGGDVADPIIRALLTDQEPFIGSDARQMTEMMARGRYSIGIGAVDEQIIVDFQAQGVGKELEAIDNNDEWTYVSGTNIWLVDKAPHPNAAKLFINWLLTKEGQTIWSKELQTNSRRVDVPAGAEERQPQRGKKYVQIDAENLIPEIDKTRELITEVLK